MKPALSEPLSFRQSFFISLFLHLLLLLILSLFLTHSPFKEEPVPIIVTIDAPAAMAEGAQATPAPPPQKEKATPRQETKPKTTTTTKQEAEKVIQQAREKTKKTTTTSKPVKSATPSASEEVSSSPSSQQEETEDDILAKSIEKALQSTGRKSTGTAATSATGQQGTGTDPLGDANWKSRPRKTIFFPDIASKIREKVANPLMGYTVTAKIVFDSQGLAVRVDIVRSSGDPLIDSIFLSELKKIRVEAITEERLDEITKTFKISVR
jgi:outer membrane biosynthesis protein TonB